MNNALLKPGKSRLFIDYKFDQGSLSSYTLVDGTPTIRLVPKRHWSNYWRWFAVRSRRWAGKTPHFLIDKAGMDILPDADEHFAVWSTSPDTDTWTDFDNVSVGATDIEFYHNSAFPSGMIYVAQLPMFPFSRTQRKVGEWDTADARIVDTPSTIGLVIANMTARVNGDGRTAPALPMYGFKLTNANANTKNNMILTAANHPSETHGSYCLEGAMAWLLGGSPEAEFLLDWFNIYVYPSLNPQGVWGGYFRSCPEDPTKDHNRQWHEDVLEDITVFRAAMAADTGGAIEVGIDYHHSYGNDTYFGDVYDTNDALAVVYATKMAVLATGYDHRVSDTNGVLQVLWHDDYAAKLAVTLEQANAKTLGITNWKNYGQNSLIGIQKMLADGQWTNGPGVGSREFNGTTDRIDRASAADLTGHALTVSVWANPDATLVNGYMFCIHVAGDTGAALIFNVNKPAAVKYVNVFIVGTTNLQRISLPGGAIYGELHHYLFTWDGNIASYAGLHIYRDGVEVGYDSNQNGATQTAMTGKWSIGGRISDDIRNFDGKLSQLRVFNRVLSPAEIALEASGVLTTSSGLISWLKENTDELHDVVDNVLWVADGTTQLTGVGNGPSIVYP